jgi:phosphate uptake regulator
MFKKLFSIVKGDSPLEKAASRFQTMLAIAAEMVVEADAVFWGKVLTPEERTALYDKDIRVNGLQRQVRKAVVTHLSGNVLGDIPHGLLLMSLVKDVERIGDYAKNVAETPGMAHPDGGTRVLPDDEVVGELRQISKSVLNLAREAGDVYARSDRQRAEALTLEGRSVSKRCDKLIGDIARSNYSAALAVDLTLGTRFYKRIEGHLLNLLSSLLMPLHKLDYYDESSVVKD